MSTNTETVHQQPDFVRPRNWSPTQQNVLDAFESDACGDHELGPSHEDFEGDGAPLYLDVEGFFDVDDDFDAPSRCVAGRKVS